LLFSIVTGIKGRDQKAKKDLEAEDYEVRLIYKIGGRGKTLTIFAGKLNNWDDQFEIEIKDEKNIKSLMHNFNYQYLSIVDNLRIVQDTLVLLSPC